MQWNHLSVEVEYMVRRKTNCGWEIPLRYIPDYELVFILNGEGRIQIREEQFQVQANDLVCFRPGVIHGLSVQKEPCMEFFGVHFRTEEREWDLPLPDIAKIEPPYMLISMMKKLYEVYQKKQYLYKWKQNVMMEQILCEVFSCLQQKSQPIELVRIQKVLTWIHTDPAHHFTLEEMLQMTGIKKSLFLESFKKTTGTSPMQYIAGLRMEYARDQLLNSEETVAQIAEKCGFSDAFYFSRCFKNYFSVSPQQYRKENI